MAKSKYKAIKVDGVKHDYHRWLMEQKLGRKLDSNEFVHHIDGDKSNNNVSNLCIMSRSEHARLHAKPPYFSEYARARSREYMTGRPSPTRKLSEMDVAFIKEHYQPRDTEYGARALARKFGISHYTISKIMSGEYYKNI